MSKITASQPMNSLRSTPVPTRTAESPQKNLQTAEEQVSLSEEASESYGRVPARALLQTLGNLGQPAASGVDKKNGLQGMLQMLNSK